MNALSPILALAAAGIPCFPCTISKAPAVGGGFKRATADPEELRCLWREHPGPLIGVPTGPASGIDVLDLDTARHPEATAWLEAHKSELPQTRIHRTRSGGLHYLFVAHRGLRNSAGKLARGIDVRATGGYIIWWPAHGCDVLCDAKPAAWPIGLLVRLQPPRPPPMQRFRNGTAPASADRLIVFVANAAPGERNAKLFWAACRAAEMSNPDSIAELLVEAATRAGLSRAEASSTVHSGLRRGQCNG